VDPAYHEAIRRRLALPLHEGPDRTATLADAVRRHVEAGDTLYVAAAHGRPNAAVREIARQWWGRAPGFTLASVGVGSPWTALIHGGLVRRTITTFMGEGYPFPTPQALISRAVLDGRLEVQNWSMLTFPLRLLAGAMGVPFLPTKSLLGSSMEEDNARAGDFAAVDDPFGGPDRVGYVRALVPDVAVVHGWVADRAGNVIIGTPMNENLYGAMAARRSGDRYGQGDVSEFSKIVPEGVEGQVRSVGALEPFVHQLVGGLRAGMKYAGAATIEDLRTKARFVRISGAGLRESHPHDVQITVEPPNYRVRS